MSRLLPFTALALSAVLAACVDEPAAPPVEGACGAPALQGLVGKDRSALSAMTFTVPMRVIEPGMPVTMDYMAERLNIELNAAGIITRVSCG